MPFLMMPEKSRELIEWMAARRQRETERLLRRIAYGGKKGRSAGRRLRRMGGLGNIWKPTERVVACLWGPMCALPPYGFARE
jgi:hypothetical protein